MADFPALAHVAVTVTDLDRSVPWYTALFGTDPVLDEDTGPFRHVVWAVGNGNLVGLHQFPDLADGEPFEERRPGLDHVAFACANRTSSSRGPPAWTSWASRTAASSTPATAPACRSVTPTTSRWSSSPRRGDTGHVTWPRCPGTARTAGTVIAAMGTHRRRLRAAARPWPRAARGRRSWRRRRRPPPPTPPLARHPRLPVAEPHGRRTDAHRWREAHRARGAGDVRP